VTQSSESARSHVHIAEGWSKYGMADTMNSNNKKYPKCNQKLQSADIKTENIVPNPYGTP
jgi:hypothetical protein